MRARPSAGSAETQISRQISIPGSCLARHCAAPHRRRGLDHGQLGRHRQSCDDGTGTARNCCASLRVEADWVSGIADRLREAIATVTDPTTAGAEVETVLAAAGQRAPAADQWLRSRRRRGGDGRPRNRAPTRAPPRHRQQRRRHRGGLRRRRTRSQPLKPTGTSQSGPCRRGRPAVRAGNAELD